MGSSLGGMELEVELLRRGWRWRAVDEGMVVGSGWEGDGGGELLIKGWRWGDVEEGMEAGSC